jgi:hypothetical protein
VTGCINYNNKVTLAHLLRFFSYFLDGMFNFGDNLYSVSVMLHYSWFLLLEICLLLNSHFVSGSSSVNKSKALASIDGIDFVFFSGANWSEGEVIKYGDFLLTVY